MNPFVLGLALLGSLQTALAISGRATYYAAGQGACGWRNTPGDFIVALNEGQFGGGRGSTAQCGRSLTIRYGGQSVVATVADCCPGCPYGALDMTEGLFNQFAGLGAGVFYMDWDWGDNAAPAPEPTTSTPPPPPPPTTTWTPTSTYVAPTTTWTPPPPPSSTRRSRSSSSSSVWTPESSSAEESSSEESSSEEASSTESAQSTEETPETQGPGINPQTGNIHNMNQIVLQLGGLVGIAVAQQA